MNEKIIRIILKHHPDTEAVYIFGTFDTPNQREESDMDIAILLPPVEAKQVGSLLNHCLLLLPLFLISHSAAGGRAGQVLGTTC